MSLKTTNQAFNVVIPTRERGDVLEKALLTVLNQDYDNLRIIISDNFSADCTRDVALSTGDPRVTYVNTGRRVSMSHNWEFALSHVREGWVTIIGDDDGLLPDALARVADIIKTTGAKAIRSTVCEYSWPSLTQSGHGSLSVPLGSGVERRDSKQWLSRVRRGADRYTALPVLYNGGYVRQSVLEAIKAKTGVVYSSRVPDVYSAVAIATVVDEYFFALDPTALNGASKHSTGTSQFSVAKKADTLPAAVFASEDNLPFHHFVPLQPDGHYPPSLHALVYESYLQSAALRDSGEDDPRRELELILAMAGLHSGDLQPWARLFAARHNLDFESAMAGAKARRLRLSVMSLVPRLLRELNTYRMESRICPLKNVHEASIAAAAIRELYPSWLRNIQPLLRRVAAKLRGGQ